MGCHVVNLPGGGRAVLCGIREPKCWRKCGLVSEFQCDFPVGVYMSGKRKGQKRDCNRHLCAEHARHGLTPNVDFCDEHYPIARAAYERRRRQETANA